MILSPEEFAMRAQTWALTEYPGDPGECMNTTHIRDIEHALKMHKWLSGLLQFRLPFAEKREVEDLRDTVNEFIRRHEQ